MIIYSQLYRAFDISPLFAASHRRLNFRSLPQLTLCWRQGMKKEIRQPLVLFTTPQVKNILQWYQVIQSVAVVQLGGSCRNKNCSC